MMKLQKMLVIGALALCSGKIGELVNWPSLSVSLIPAAFGQTTKQELPACLVEIAKATVIEDAALPSCKLRNSMLEAQKLGAGARGDLIDLVQNATPAGRLISLALLKKIDIEQFKKLTEALKQELGDQSVAYTSATERCHYTVADILNDMASSKPLIKILPGQASVTVH